MTSTSAGVSSGHFSIVPYAAFVCIYASIMAVAFVLDPAPEGVGTHTQLGLPGCGFLNYTGWPCPSCGLTTATALLFHGLPVESIRTQPFAPVLILTCTIGFLLTPVAVSKRISLGSIIQYSWFENLQSVLLGVFVLSWIYKIIVMY